MTGLTKQSCANLLVRLQRGIPLVRRPLREIAAATGMTEDVVLQAIRAAFDGGVARRFGAVFDSRSLGYESTLCAVDVADGELEDIAGEIALHSGVTHCYERGGRPNLWFTMTAPAASLPAGLDKIACAVAPRELLSLPALRVFKIAAVFDTTGTPRDPDCREGSTTAGDRETTIPLLSERERSVVRRLQGSIPLTRDPLADAAVEIGYAHDELLELLTAWQERGLLRRIGLIVRHHRLGFTANSMCVWPAPPEHIESAGKALARHREVTHCYQRPACGVFPFNLYAMIHANSAAAVRELFERLSTAAGLSDGRMLVSLREFKKVSPTFFCEGANGGQRAD